MKFTCFVLLVLWGLAIQVSAQTEHGNYLLASYNEAMLIKSYYDEEVQYYREYLTYESEDMGVIFTDMVADAVAVASNPVQGERIGQCGFVTAYLGRNNIVDFERYINIAQNVGNGLHMTVLGQLRNQNIKEYDLELFYYYHSYIMQEAYDDLWYVHTYNMLYAWLDMLFDFFDLHDALDNCLLDAMELEAEIKN